MTVDDDNHDLTIRMMVTKMLLRLPLIMMLMLMMTVTFLHSTCIFETENCDHAELCAH